ncbi:MAG: lysophospholipid acyltransferase family protein [Planctomycetota bacterium]|jgi:1-acyl-sn-glycerol-3-phosphate acyltransferase|nr:lysophospholipid acyltransferase family protein [Planctomycetota bacterium]
MVEREKPYVPVIRNWVFWPCCYLMRLASWLYFRVSVRGKRNYPQRPFVAVVNHASFLDMPVMAWGLDRGSHFLGKAELFKIPVFSWFLRCWGGIPLRRDAGDVSAMDLALAKLRDGEAVYITPEGTRKHAADGSARPRTGFVRLAQLAGCPVVPIAVGGVRRAMPPGAIIPRPVKIRISIGEPIHLAPIEVSHDNHDALQEQACAVMDRIYEMKRELESGAVSE